MTTVLIIDDETSVADGLRLILTDIGYEVTVAATGTNGIEIARAKKFDLTITDLRLPDMSGLNVLSSIRKSDSKNQVIVITAFSTPEVVVESMNRGAVGVLSKPFFPSELITLLDKALSRTHQSERQPAS